MKSNLKAFVAVLTLTVIGSSFANAQTQAENVTVTEQSNWKHDLTLYFLGAGMSGTVGLGPVEGDVDASFSDIASNLNFGMMGNYRAENGRFSVGADIIYVGLGADLIPAGEMDFDQWMVEANVGWKLTEHIEVLAGARYNRLSGSMVMVNPPQTASGSKGWVDPIVGGRLWLPIAGSFSAIFRADIGGFGVGSELTWQLGGYLIYKTQGSLSWIAGWRYFSIEYEDSAPGYFLYDMDMQGPAIGASWAF